MNRTELLNYLTRIDAGLRGTTELVVYGSAAFILLGEEERTSLDVDVAGPYSRADFAAFQQAAQQAGLPVNPDDAPAGEHIEWVPALRLCLPPPMPETEQVLWQGRTLTVKTVSPPELIASKLSRYDDIDQSDIQFLCAQRPVTWQSVAAAVRSLPPPFNENALVQENLANLQRDMALWRGTP
jgi:hypothetical protein